MLELKEIKKVYQTESLRQVALNDVSICFRDKEFEEGIPHKKIEFCEEMDRKERGREEKRTEWGP